MRRLEPSRDVLGHAFRFRDELEEFHSKISIEPVSWCDYPCGIIHDFKWVNFLTNKRGGPRFGVVLLHLRPPRNETMTSGGIGSLIKKFEEELQVS